MKHLTYEILYQAHNGYINKSALLEAQSNETDPFIRHWINLMLEKADMKVDWNVDLFTTQFRSGTPRKLLDETVFAFLLRLVAIIKEERYLRAFQKPESFDAVMAWEALLRRIILCSLALLYNVQWTPESIFNVLEPYLMELLSEGNTRTMRQLMESVGIPLADHEPYQAELQMEKLNFLHVGQYSSFYWRFLHWMAEAFQMRDDTTHLFYKNVWLDLLSEPLYRTLRCGICMHHFSQLLNEQKSQLMDKSLDFPKLFFEIHNRVHAQRREQYPFLTEPDYTESEFEEDRTFMRQALLP